MQRVRCAVLRVLWKRNDSEVHGDPRVVSVVRHCVVSALIAPELHHLAHLQLKRVEVLPPRGRF